MDRLRSGITDDLLIRILDSAKFMYPEIESIDGSLSGRSAPLRRYCMIILIILGLNSGIFL
jgi:hypothetical protein